jgi:hypothetical protein
VLVFHEGFTSRIAMGIVLVLFAVTLIVVGNDKKVSAPSIRKA